MRGIDEVKMKGFTIETRVEHYAINDLRLLVRPTDDVGSVFIGYDIDYDEYVKVIGWSVCCYDVSGYR